MHRAEQILEAVVSAIESQADRGAAVVPHLALTLSEDDQELPAVAVRLGSDDPVSELGTSNLAYIDSVLQIRCTVYARHVDQAEEARELMRLRSVVHRALMADQTLGLDFVMGVRYGGASEPERDAAGGQIAGRMDCLFGVLYRMNLTDPE